MNRRQQFSEQTDATLILSKGVASSDKAKRSNMVLSPLSIQVLLSLLANGFNKDGSTLKPLLSFLGSQSIDSLNTFCSEIVSNVCADGRALGGPSLVLANAVWFADSLTLKSSFKQLLCDVFKADINYVDFYKTSEVIAEINSWAEKKTNGLIKCVVDRGSVHPSTIRISANAIYFKGAWESPFEESNTKDFNFYLHNGNKVKVPFMCSNELQLIGTFDEFKVTRLPYKYGEDSKRRFAMYIFLPNKNDGLFALEEKIMSGSSDFLNKHLPKYPHKEVGDYRIPKFKIEFGFEVTDAKMGVGLDFLSEESITEMAECPINGVSSILHKAFIEVNEGGTEAAAVTVEDDMGCSLWQNFEPKVDFVADHPFMFLIQEDLTGLILFVGHVLDPSESG
ncbi:hypothetical protein ACFE04_016872 [Oxalis oulophora]